MNPVPTLPLLFRRATSSTTQLQGQQQQDHQQQQPEQEQQQVVQQQQHYRRYPFHDMLCRLKAFQQSKGRFPRHQEVDADGVRIGLWVKTQRRSYHVGKLSAECIAALERVPGWAWRVAQPKSSWHERFARLKAFQQSRGATPQQNEVDHDGVRIGNWVHFQRQSYQRKQMPANRIAALEEVPGWSWSERTEFDDWVDMARAFQQANGCIPKCYDTWDGKNVGLWVKSTRSAYKKGGLSQEKITACETITGWVWKVTHRRTNRIPFDLGLSALKAFVEAHGRLPTCYEIGGQPLELHLGRWVMTCRSRKRKGQLTLDQIAGLEGVLGWWWEKPPRPFRLW